MPPVNQAAGGAGCRSGGAARSAARPRPGAAPRTRAARCGSAARRARRASASAGSPWRSQNSRTSSITSRRSDSSRGAIGAPKRTSTLWRRENSAAVPAARPVLAGRHRVVGALDVDRDDVDAVLRGDHRGARADLADRAVARAGALGEHHEVPALADDPVDVVGGAVAEAAAVAAERHGVEEQRDAAGLPAALVEVVGRRRDRRAVAPLARDRAQDRRRVEMARVVGDEDDGRRRCGRTRRGRPCGGARRSRSSGRGRT